MYSESSKDLSYDMKLDKILECMHKYHEEEEYLLNKISENNNEETNTMNYGASMDPTGNNYNGYGVDGMGGGNLMGFLLGILLGNRGGFFGNNGDNCCDRQLIIDAITNKVGAVEKIAELTHSQVEFVKHTLCEVKAKAEALGVAIDCVKDHAKETLDRVHALSEKFCDHRAEVAREFGDVRYRDLENHERMKDFVRLEMDKADCKNERRYEKLDCKIEGIEKTLCDARIRELEQENCRLRTSCNSFESRETNQKDAQTNQIINLLGTVIASQTQAKANV